jgi:hypothetical protein
MSRPFTSRLAKYWLTKSSYVTRKHFYANCTTANTVSERSWREASPDSISRVGSYSLMANSVVLLSMLISAAGPSRAQAQVFEGFGPSFQYDHGLNPSVAVSGATIVEVHNGTGGVGPLWYRVGYISWPYINWSNSHQYDYSGLNPSVALNGTTVVEVHNGGAGAGPLWYRVGQVNGSTISWSNSHQYDYGNNPSITLAGNTVVEVHTVEPALGPSGTGWAS